MLVVADYHITVYPRVCGGPEGQARCRTPAGLSPRVRGHRPDLPTYHSRGGLSPRVRGHHSADSPTIDSGSIPACAGAPSGGRRPIGTARVYPRVCGGTRAKAACASRSSGLSPRVRGHQRPAEESSQFFQGRKLPAPAGLSPRVRGHLLDWTAANLNMRSIPACAGAPPETVANYQHRRVYPRVCGGTYGS